MDEIERLHEAWKQACARTDDPLQKDLMFLKAMELAYGMDRALPELLALREEVGRLREALTEVVLSRSFANKSSCYQTDIARAALNQEPKP